MTGAGGVPIATWDLGGEGPPLLLLHATGFHARMWLPLAPVLCDHFRVWAVDQRGHGASGHAPDCSYLDWSRFVDDTLAVVDRLDAGPGLVAAGHSLGGGVLLLTEQARPGVFDRLYCYEPIVVPPGQRDRVRAGGNTLADLARRRRPAFVSRSAARANFASKAPFASFAPAALDAYVDHGLVEQDDGTVRLVCPPEEEATVYEGAMRHQGWEHLGDNRSPLVVAGGGEATGPAALLDAMAAAHPAARVERLADLDHFGPMTEPERVATAMVAALAPHGIPGPVTGGR